MALRFALLALLIALAPLAAEAQSYRCVGADGKKYYGQTIPPQCAGLPVEQLNTQGQVIKRLDPAAEAQARKDKEADAAKKRESETASKERSRRNSALLATYTSAGDVEEARGRALAENDKAMKEIETRISSIRKRQAGYDKELEFYREGTKKGDDKSKAKATPTGSNPPAKLVEDMKMAEVDLKLQEEALAERSKQIETINAKYDEDKKRYQELTGRK
jgi:hypothetical protein